MSNKKSSKKSPTKKLIDNKNHISTFSSSKTSHVKEDKHRENKYYEKYETSNKEKQEEK